MYKFPNGYYCDVRIEEHFKTLIRYEPAHIEEMKESCDKGAFIRVFDGERWHYSSTTEINDIQQEIDQLTKLAKHNPNILQNNIVEKFEVNTGEYLKFNINSVANIPINEKHPLQPQSPYSASKIGADAIAMSFHNAFNLPVTIVRPFNTYGPRMRAGDGRVVPTFITQALDGDPLTCFGDGSQTRSFCFVDDLIEGIYRLLLSGEHEPTNIGNPSEMSVLEFAREIIRLTNSKSEIIFTELPEDDPKVRQPDITKARNLLGWEPTVLLEEGLGKTIEYFASKGRS